MNLSKEDYFEIYNNIENAILSISRDSNVKKIKHEYFLSNKDIDNFDTIYQVVVAQLRQSISKIFDNYIDKELALEVQNEVERRKRPRKPKMEIPKVINEVKWEFE